MSRLLAFLAALVLILQLVGVAALARYRDQLGQTFALAEPAADPVQGGDVPDQVALAFEKTALQDAVDNLGRVLLPEDGAEALRYFDTERMLEEMSRTGVRKPPAARDRAAILRTIQKGVERSLLASPIRWEKSEICRARFLDADHNDAEIVVWHRSLVAGRHKVRWWLHRGPLGWRFYDMEDLDLGLRLSLVTGLITQSQRGRERDTLLRLEHAAWALKAKNFDEADRILTRFEAEPLGAHGEAYRWTLKAHLALRQNRPADALTCIDRAEAIAPHPRADLVRATARNQLGEHAEALALGQRVLERLGFDADASRQIGMAAARLGRSDEAFEAYRASLFENPAMETLMEFRAALSAERKDELAVWMRRVPQPRLAFRALAAEALGAGDHQAVDIFVETIRNIEPQFPGADVVKARQSIRRKKVNIGIAQFKAAIGKVPEQERNLYVRDFLDDMLTAGKPVEAYRAAPDKGFAFQYLADKLQDKADRVDELHRLQEEHKGRQPREE